MRKVHLEVSPYLDRHGEEFVKIIHRDLEVVSIEESEAVLVLGGDGTMLETIRRHHQYKKPFFGLNFGHIGFLLSEADEECLEQIINGNVQVVQAQMLEATLFDQNGNFLQDRLAFNDFYFERASIATANIQVKVNGKIRFENLRCDGIIAATPAGSTAYNASAGGTIVPIDSNIMVLTAISPAIFHRWRSSYLPADATVELTALDTNFRPVRLLADGIEVEGVVQAVISYSRNFVEIGFASGQDYREKVLNLQFNSV